MERYFETAAAIFNQNKDRFIGLYTAIVEHVTHIAE